ncbi:MAG: hypothetical protein GY815_04210 [Gammaproteobacteria bacterium]|nr:hypothetical protein [Gammaproteobacteria bacterium]
MTAVSTSAITLAAASVNLQTVGGGTTFGSLPIPVSGTGAGANALSIDDQGASPADASRIPADTVLELHSDGGAETGEADIYVTILWDNV